MKWAQIKNRIQYGANFVPFKMNFYIYIIVLIVLYRLLQAGKNETNSFIGLTILMAKIVFLFSIFIVLVSFFSVLISAVYFYYKKKKYPQDSIQLKMETQHEGRDILLVETQLHHALKPILGFVSVQLYYDRFLSSEKYLLTNRIKKQWIPLKAGVAGTSKLVLPFIKEYHFSNAVVYFEDMIQFFSIAVSCSIQSDLLNAPKNMTIENRDFFPKKTEEEETRIEQLRKVEGELLHYKKFENSDDVRRIVWKIYAKNKELVVRMPETLNPFASHIYMYASFFNGMNFQLYEQHSAFMLSYFKNCVWTLYETLAQNKLAVRYISDQEINQNKNEIDRTKFTITLSNWHQDFSLTDYFKPKLASVLCIHSGTPYEDVQKIVNSYEEGTTVFFVQFNTIFKSYFFAGWLMRIFFKAPHDDFANMKSTWILHPMRSAMIRNEQKIIDLLKKEGITFEVI